MPRARVLGAAMIRSGPQLSVVVAAERVNEALAATLRRWTAGPEGAAEELLVVLGSAADEATVRRLAPAAEILRGRPRALVPELWALGIEAARAPWVALTIGDCVPAGVWRRRLRAALESAPDSVAGIGGPIHPPVGGGGREWALFLLRYSGYLDVPSGPCREIPGDNAAYRREDLAWAWRDRTAGFWEVRVHDELRRAGRELLFDLGLGVRLVAAPTTLRTTVMRFRHGFRFAATRSLPFARRFVAAVAAPLLVPLLLARVRRRVVTTRSEWRSRLRLAMPWLLLFVLAWSLGEGCGYWAALVRPSR